MKITPSEIIYWKILPAIRKEIVFQMVDLKEKQVNIARYIEVTPSAISQYLSNKRGEFNFSKKFKGEVRKSAKKIISGEASAFEETNILIKKFEKNKDICIVCNEENNTLKGCNVCYS